MVPLIFDQLYHLAFHFGALNGGLHRLEFRHGNMDLDILPMNCRWLRSLIGLDINSDPANY
jgi:hypothetical protein